MTFTFTNRQKLFAIFQFSRPKFLSQYNQYRQPSVFDVFALSSFMQNLAQPQN